MKRIIKQSIFLAGLGFSIPGIAGEASLQGSATVLADPDCVSLPIDIAAECYPTPASASDAADKAANSIYSFLQGLINLDRDELISSGGYTKPFERYLSDGKKECRGTFQKAVQITLKVRNVSDFMSNFAQIQNKIFAEFTHNGAATDGNLPVVSVSLGSPNPELTAEHEEALGMTAQRLAANRAIERFLASIPSSCKVTGYQVSGISEPTSYTRPGYGAASAPAAGGNSGGPVVSFGKQEVSRSVLVKVSFDGGHCMTENP